MNPSRVAVLGLLTTAVFALSGCGGAKTHGVTGKVTYKSQPVPGAIVVLYSMKGTDTFSVRSGTDGTFTLDKVPEGEYKVSITAASAAHDPHETMRGSGMAAKGAAMGKVGEAAGKKEQEMRGKIGDSAEKGALGADIRLPRKYADQTTSGLTWNTKTETTKEFALTD